LLMIDCMKFRLYKTKPLLVINPPSIGFLHSKKHFPLAKALNLD
jgi:hypothetical protein